MKRNSKILCFVISTIILAVNLNIWRYKKNARDAVPDGDTRSTMVKAKPLQSLSRRAPGVTLDEERFRNQELKMKTELEKINKTCHKYSKLPYWQNIVPSGLVWNYDKLDLHYCFVPKVACTYWKRIFMFVSHDYPARKIIRAPSDLDKMYVHFTKPSNIRVFSMTDAKSRNRISNKGFMFVREPYSRLWSAYIDKYLLPDFWAFDKKFILAAKPNASEEEQSCGKNLKFQDFLTAVCSGDPSFLEPHWRPMHLLCSPCHVQYAAIGKLESFGNDVDFLLRKFGIYLNQTFTERDRMLEEVRTLVPYNFGMKRLKQLSDTCFDEMDVAERLWRAFQYNGYIDRNIEFPMDVFQGKDFKSNATGIFTEVVERRIANQAIDGKKQRRDMLLEAYKDIPRELLARLKEIYKYDFELFGYDPDLIK